MEMMAAAVPRSSRPTCRPFFSRRFLLPDAPDAGQHRVRDFCSGDRKRIGGSGPQAADTPREKCCRFDGDASGRRMYGYVENDPLDEIDPLGLDTLVITSGYNGGYNFFGHSALAFTGQGLYSYGTADPYGSGVTSYLQRQLSDRSVTITRLSTTPRQEQSMAAYYQSKFGPGSHYSAFGGHNCADASGGALTSSGAVSSPTGLATFPADVGAAAAAAPGATTVTLPAGSPVPGNLGSFNPQ
jgi:hypothetical protein